MATPRVSVLMSVFNGREYLPEAVESVLAQTFSDFEFLIVDDGSTDGASDLLREYAAGDSRIRLIPQENQGLTRSLNNGLAVARGEYVARMDADDVCLPERFEKQVAFLDQNPECVAMGSPHLTIDGEGEEVGRREVPTDHDTIDAWNLEGHTAIPHPALMVRRDDLERIGGYEERYETAQDLDLLLRLGEIGRLANLTEPLIKYRWHGDNISVTKADNQDRDVVAMIAAAQKRRGLRVSRRAPKFRWKYRTSMARTYAREGDRETGLRFARRAIAMRPFAYRSWYTFVRVLISKRRSATTAA